tara:strand:+ start:1072 stop:8112 length:7041 start_codon:yes stop_codon:yes gene_type:complete
MPIFFGVPNMAQKFVLTAQLQLQAPKNVRSVVRDINKQLKGVHVDIDVKGAAKAQKDIKAAADATKQMGKEMEKSAGGVRKMDLALGKALKQVFRYDIARAILNTFRRTLEDNVRAAIDFEREMIKVAQVTNQSMSALKDLQNEISRLSTNLGVSSASLVKTSRVLAQTGLSAKDVKIALESLAKTSLAPTFDDITDTTETAIAAMRQFKLEAKDLDRVLGQINSVAGKFAVEAGDIGVAIRRAGGAFKSAGGELEELIALFTSVRSTTRETAETIATGFRTIFTRMQRPETIEFLRTFGIELQDLEGKFVGPYEAVNRLNKALAGLDPRDVRYSQIVEQLGGFRQVSKVIPLIQQFSTAQAALNVAQKESGSLSRDAITAQASLAIQIQKLTEDVKELFRSIVESKAFQVLASGALKLADALVKIGDTLAPILPMLATLGAVKIAKFGFGRIFGGGDGAAGKQFGGRVSRFSSGGLVPGKGNGDTVPALLESGEFVLRKSAVNSIGAGRLASMNRYAKGGSVTAKGSDLRPYRRGVGDLFNRKAGRDWDKERGVPWKKSGDLINQFGLDDTFTAQNTHKPVGFHASTLQKYPALATRYKQARKTGDLTEQGRAWEALLAGSKKLTKFKGSSPPLDGTLGGAIGDAAISAKSHSDSLMANKLYRHRFLNEEGFLTGKKATHGDDHFRIGSVAEFIPTAATLRHIDAFTVQPKTTGGVRGTQHNAAGGITGHGTDTVPSLLTPGEFVINKKSAQSIGYGNLYSMNKMADGGVVGGGGFLEVGGGGGGLDLTSIIMQFAMLQGVMGGFSGTAKEGTEALDGVKDSAGGIKHAMGEMLPVLGNIAQTGLMVYTKWSVLGGIATQFADSVFGASDSMHFLIDSTVMAATAMQMFSIVREMDMAGLMSGLKMFGGKLADIAAGTFGWGKALLTGAGVGGAGVAAKKARGAMTGFGQRIGGYGRGTLESFRAGRSGGPNIAMGMGDSPGKIVRRGEARKLYGRFGPNIKSVSGRAGFAASEAGRLGHTRGSSKILHGLNTATQKTAQGMGKFARTMANVGPKAAKALSALGAAAAIADIALASYAGSLKNQAQAMMTQAEESGRALTAGEQQALITQEKVSDASTGSTVGGIVGGLVGMIGGPLGAAVGAAVGSAVGGAFGWFTSAINGTSQALEDISRLEFNAAATAWEKSLTDHEKGLKTTESVLRDYSRANDAASKRAGELVQNGWFWDKHASEESVQALEEFKIALKEASPQIVAFAQAAAFEKQDAEIKRSEEGTAIRVKTTATGRVIQEEVEGEDAASVRFAQQSFKDFESNLEKSGTTLSDHARMQGKTTAELRSQVMAEAEAHYKVTQAMKEFDEAVKASTENLMKSIEVSDAVTSMGASVEAVDNRMANLSSNMDGAVTAGKMGGRFSSAEVAAISTKSEQAAFEERVKNIAGEMGTGGGAMATDMLGAQKIMSNITGALGAEKDRGKIEGQSMGKRVMDRLKDDIDLQFGGGTFDELPQHLKKKIKARLDAATAEVEGGKDFNEAFEEAGASIQEDLASGFEPMRQAFEETAKLFDTFNTQLAQAYAERRKVEMDIIEAQKGVVSMQWSNEKRLAKMEGRDITQADFRAVEIRKQQIQLGGTDIAKAKGGTGLVGADDLGQELLSLKQRINESNNRLSNFGATTGSTGEETEKLGDKFAEAQKENDNLKKQYKQVEGALKSYTNIQERLSAVTEELTRLQEIRASKEKTMEDLAFGTDEDREKWADSVNNLQRALSDPRGLEALSGEDRRGVQQLLNSMNENQIFAATGQTRQQMMEQLLGNFATGVGGPSWGTSQARGRMGLEATQEEKDKIEEAKGIMREGETAADALIEPLKQDRDELNKVLTTIHENFLVKFQKILEEKFQTREQKEKASQEAAMGDANDRMERMSETLKKVVGKDRFDAMSDADRTAAIKAMKGQQENIDMFANASERIRTAEGAAEVVKGGKNFFDYTKDAYGDNQGAFGFGWMDDNNIGDISEASRFLETMEKDLELQTRNRLSAQGTTGDEQQKVVDEVMAGFEKWKTTGVGGAQGLASMNEEMDEIFEHFETFMAGRATDVKEELETAKENFQRDMGDAGFKRGEMAKFRNEKFAADIYEDLEKISMNDSFGKLKESVEDAAERIEEATQNINKSKETAKQAEQRAEKFTQNKASGGVVYASGGRFIPRGTDTVPAMLTPGEFVVRRQAVKSVGIPFLKALNSQGAKGMAKGFSKGGTAYLANGGMGVSLDSSAFDASVNRFSGHIDRLGEVLGKGFSVQVGGKVDVVVHIPAAETLANIKGSVGNMVDNQITKGINDMLAKHFPQIGRQSTFTKTPLGPMGQ